MINKLTSMFNSIYGENVDLNKVKDRYSLLIENHLKMFNTSPNYIFSSPGRVEVIGNHTDHNGGLTLGSSIDLDIIASVSYRNDLKIIIYSPGFKIIEIDLNDVSYKEEEKGKSISLVKGIIYFMKKRGININIGLNINTESNIPIGLGLSSSASFELLIANILNNLFYSNSLNEIELSLISKDAENFYFGKASGALDQLCVSHNGISYIDFKDEELPKIESLKLDLSPSKMHFVLVDTSSKHVGEDNLYSLIPNEMKLIASYFGKKRLIEIEKNEFLSSIPKLRSSLNNDRAILRALHFFEENERVKEAKEAIINSDINSLINLIDQSGNSSASELENIYDTFDYQPISIALAISKEILKSDGASRVHGGGFMGSILALLPKSLFESYKNKMELIFGKGCVKIVNFRNFNPFRLL